MAKRERAQSSRPGAALARLLAAASAGLVTALLFLPEDVAADGTWRPWVVWPPAQPTRTCHTRQERIVEAEVAVNSQRDVALLHSLGYSCGIGPCRLELLDGEEKTLTALGLPVQVVERAIRISGAWAAPAPAAAAVYEEYDVGGKLC